MVRREVILDSVVLCQEGIFELRLKESDIIIHLSPSFHSCCCSVVKLYVTLCDPMDCSSPDFPPLHYLSEFPQTDVHRIGDAIQPSHPLSSPSPPAFNLSQHQGLFKCVSCLHQVAKVLEFQLQHQSFQ